MLLAFCPSFPNLSFLSGYDKIIKRSASLVHAHLEKVTHRVAVRNMLLMDYLEDMLDFILETESDPCVLNRFIDQCILLPAELSTIVSDE